MVEWLKHSDNQSSASESWVAGIDIGVYELGEALDQRCIAHELGIVRRSGNWQ